MIRDARPDDARAMALVHITGDVSTVYVLAEYWETGVGREFWLEAVSYLSAVDFGAVTLWVLVDNLRAIHSYRTAGLDPYLGSQRSITRGGRALAEFRYRKPLEPIC
ncbi:hypothetical protein CCL23_11810 [Pseudomonas syringae]|nr:hypothetical protein CCL23_11810 [Pseudomonas syringae]